jgi:hypothetical protein
VAVPLMLVWAAVALALGKAQERRQALSPDTEQERAQQRA